MASCLAHVVRCHGRNEVLSELNKRDSVLVIIIRCECREVEMMTEDLVDVLHIYTVQ